jgi:hypothetical protein
MQEQSQEHHHYPPAQKRPNSQSVPVSLRGRRKKEFFDGAEGFIPFLTPFLLYPYLEPFYPYPPFPPYPYPYPYYPYSYYNYPVNYPYGYRPVRGTRDQDHVAEEEQR